VYEEYPFLARFLFLLVLMESHGALPFIYYLSGGGAKSIIRKKIGLTIRGLKMKSTARQG